MDNANADSANDRDMSKSNDKMTREQMQTEAMIIESLLVTVQGLHGSTDPEDAASLVDMAQERASRLNRALDSVNAPKVPS